MNKMYLLSPDKNPSSDLSTTTGLQIRLLGEFAFELDGKPVAAQAWQRSHAKRLVQLLCSAPNQTETRARVLSTLWPESDDERARNRLHHTLHCVRKAWADLPENVRPQILVAAERVTFVAAPNTVIDVQVFLHGVEADCTEAEARLDSLVAALEKYRGTLAPGWDDCPELQARRTWLEELCVSALQEAVDTAIELARPQLALHMAHQLALRLETDCDAHCQYAELLANNQRPDAALLHCQDVRRIIQAEDPSALARLDSVVKTIQQQANRRPAKPATGLAQPGATMTLSDNPTAISPQWTEAPVDGPLVTAEVDWRSPPAGTANGGLARPASMGLTDVVEAAVLMGVDPFARGSHGSQSLGLVSRLCVPMPPRSALGYEVFLQSCVHCIEDPYGSVISLVGPPGAGKSLLAHTVAHRLQSQMQHGAMHIDCSEVRDLVSLLAALASGLDPLCGPVAADELSLSRALQNKELLIVLDNLCVASSQLSLGRVTGLAGRDTRWLITAWSARHLLGERLVHLEPSQLLTPPSHGGPSHAAQIMLAVCAPSWRIQDARSLQWVEKICVALDGLPLSLEIAGQCLTTMSPSELLARLERDPCALMRVPSHDADAAMTAAARLSAAVSAWLLHTTADSRRMLSLLSRCQSWLTREDIACLMGRDAGPFVALAGPLAPPAQALETGRVLNVDALIEHCLRHQFLLRRARPLTSAPWSEFRVPRVVSAALRLCRTHTAADVTPGSASGAAGPQWAEQRLAGWLSLGHLAASPEAGGAPASASRWFDDHIEDIDAAALSHLEAGRLQALGGLCLAHAPHWSLGRHSARVRVWLRGLGETLAELPAADAASLLVARARLRVHLGELHLACDDASRALARVVGDQNADVRRQAMQLIQRYGINQATAAQQPRAQSTRGVEAGESLLRVAQLAVRHGQLLQAHTVCGQALEVFSYFGLSHGLIKAHHYRAKIAFGMGHTEGALRSLADVQRVATQSNDLREAARASLMQANVLASQMQFSQAIDLASKLIAKPEFAADPALLARGTSVVAWAQYGQGAYPLARALCQGLRDQASAAQGATLRIETEMLSALIEAQCQRPEAALRSACAALELLIQSQPLSDTQSDLINVAELAHCLHRSELAQPLLQSLAVFAAQPDHRLRDWVSERATRLAKPTHATHSMAQGAAQADLPVQSFEQVLARLTEA
jgi:DNA-binding SARP family transcriptional activator